MPYYIYLDLQHVFAGDLQVLWDTLKKKVEARALPDFASLQYPPHVTISGSFEMEEKDLDTLIKSVQDVFAYPFSTSISEQSVHLGPQICCYNFVWEELSQRVKHLKDLYPGLPWVIEGYHLTLLHGPQTSAPVTVMKGAARLLPKFPILQKDFDVVVWRHTSVENAKFSWMSKKWLPIARVPLRSL